MGVEVGGGHRDLIVEQSAHRRTAVEAVGDAGAWAVARDVDPLERLQRELAERGVVEELRRAERRRHHLRIPRGVEHAVDVWRRAGLPLLERACVVVAVGLLRSRPAAVDLIGEPRLHVAQHVCRALAIARDAQRFGRLDVHPQQAGVDVEQLLLVRPRPVPLRGVAEEPAVNLVVEAAPSHRVERGLDDMRHRRILRLAIEIERELERRDQRKLWPRSRIRRGPRRTCRRCVRRCPGSCRHRERGTSGLLLGGRQLLAPRPERLGDALEHRRHALERHVGAAADDRSLRGQKRRCRPPAQAVAIADVGTAVGVDSDGDELLVDYASDARVGVGCAVHVEARLAPRRGNRQEHGPVLGARAREGLGAPGKPADGVHDHGQL